MRKILIFLALLLPLCDMLAQNTPDEFLAMIPQLPDNLYIQKHEAIAEWADALTPLSDRMQELLAEEKSAGEEAVAKGQPNMALFNPDNESAVERYRTTMAGSEELQMNLTAAIEKISAEYIEGKSRVTIKYHEPIHDLHVELSEAQASGKNTTALRERIRVIETEECRELAVVRRDFLTAYREFLQENMPSMIRINELTDELNRMTYESYEFKTRYGFWMSSLHAFIDELAHLYDDVPGSGSEMEGYR